MPLTNANAYMLLFCATLTVTYLVVRLGLVHATSAFIAGTMINGLCFFLYATARENPFSYALIVGAFLGILFTGLSVGLGIFFNTTAQKARFEDVEVKAVSH
jgi:hypothetical protein